MAQIFCHFSSATFSTIKNINIFTFQAVGIRVRPGSVFPTNHVVWTNSIKEHCTSDSSCRVDVTFSTEFGIDDNTRVPVNRVRTNNPFVWKRRKTLFKILN